MLLRTSLFTCRWKDLIRLFFLFIIFSLPFTTFIYIPYQAIAQNKTTLPIANAGSNQTIKSGTTVTLDGSASRDPAGNKLNYYWTQVAGK